MVNKKIKRSSRKRGSLKITNSVHITVIIFVEHLRSSWHLEMVDRASF